MGMGDKTRLAFHMLVLVAPRRMACRGAQREVGKLLGVGQPRLGFENPLGSRAQHSEGGREAGPLDCS